MENLTITISRSYARKINRRLYGGNDFETADFWASYSEVVLANTPQARQKEISALLYDMARSDVEEAMQEELKKIQKPQQDKIHKEHAEEYKADPLNSLDAEI